MRIASSVVVVLVTALAGCGGLTREQRAANTVKARKMAPGTVMTDGQIAALDQDNTLVCDTETGTGSHIPHRVCRPLRKANDQANNVQTSMSQLPQSNAWNSSISGVSAGGK
ncbi:MAG TPA: hypothetical protein VFA20_32885 [Myxococcaceae bacterium]|nr:hypothetical protein [Myxococcaceae bacterium]